MLPAHFPELPRGPDAAPWSHNCITAHTLISERYGRAVRVLNQEDGDPVYMQTLLDTLSSRMAVILQSLVDEIHDMDWALEATDCLGNAITLLNQTIRALRDRYVHSPVKSEVSTTHVRTYVSSTSHPVVVHQPLRVEKLASGPGHPRKVINEQWLADAVSPRVRLNISQIARTLHIHRETVRSYLDQYNIDTSYADVSDEVLDDILRQFKTDQPSAGFSLAQSHLRVLGLKVQTSRTYKSLLRIDQLGRALRNNPAITRRVYFVPRCNHLWHMDGHHKLILWGIVIHGIVDGFNREVSHVRS